jgi:hypothetical protein
MQNPKSSNDSGKPETLIQNPKSKIQNRRKMARATQGQTRIHERLARVYGGEDARKQAT